MTRTPSANLPTRIACFVDSSKIRANATGFEPCDWFAITAKPGRMWGCHVLLHEGGAFYRDVPPHWLAFSPDPEPDWTPQQAQLWDCYGWDFGTIAYDRLAELDAIARVQGQDLDGRYLFNAVPWGDGFSADPIQAKEFVWIALDNGRLTIQPTNKVMLWCKSITPKRPEWPRDLVAMTTAWASE